MRAFGKGYEEFYERVQKEKVNIIRGKVPEITDFAESPEEKGKLIIQCRRYTIRIEQENSRRYGSIKRWH